MGSAALAVQDSKREAEGGLGKERWQLIPMSVMSEVGHERAKGDVCVESVRLPTADIGPREP